VDKATYMARIKAAYEGEIYGEAWFAAMADEAATPDRQRKLATMAQLERQTRTHMAPLIARLGIAGIDEAAQRAKGIQLARRHASLSWPAFVAWFIEEIQRFVELYDEMQRESAQEDAAILTALARHERALLEFAHLEAQGLTDQSLEPVLALLHEQTPHSVNPSLR
jgi:hypothetical protein